MIVVSGITLMGITPAYAADGFDYVNAEYPPLPLVDGRCEEEGYATDPIRNRCVSMRGWCKGFLWTCEGRPARNNHPQFVCNMAKKREQRCCREWWPPQEGITPADAQGLGRCWQYEPTKVG
jgi:hypothetical protein